MGMDIADRDRGTADNQAEAVEPAVAVVGAVELGAV